MQTIITPIRKHPIIYGVLWLIVLETVFTVTSYLSYDIYDVLDGTIGYFTSVFATEIPSALVAVAIIIWLGGRKVLSTHALKHSSWLKESPYFLLLAFVPTFLGLFSDISDGTPLATDWLLSLSLAAIFDLLVGIYEESQFRGIIFGILLPKFGKTKGGLFFASIAASLIFGMEHVNFFAGTEPVIVVQHVLKVVQVGILGMFFCALSFKEKSLWPAIILHALWDFSADLSTLPFEAPTNPSYVQTGAGAWDLVWSYLYYIALELPLLIQAVRMLKKISVPDGGWFATTTHVEDEDLPSLTQQTDRPVPLFADANPGSCSPHSLPHAGPSQKHLSSLE